MTVQTVELPTSPKRNGKMLDKELISAWALVCDVPGRGLIQTAIFRCWMGKSRNASTVYASVWVNDSKNYDSTSGHGKAGGGGYHKASAAIGYAIDNAGIKLSQDICGRGDSAIEDVLFAIAAAQGHAGSCCVVRI